MSDTTHRALTTWADRGDPIGPDALLERLRDPQAPPAEPIGPTRAAEPRRRWSVAIAAAAVVLVLVGLVPLLISQWSAPADLADPTDTTITTVTSAPPDTTVITTANTTVTSAPTTIPPASSGPSLDPPPGGLAVIDGSTDAAFDVHGYLTDTVAFGGDWVIGGSACDEAGANCVLTTWISPDGVKWTRHESGLRGDPLTLIEHADLLLAGGRVVESDGTCGPEVWTSPDAVTWTAAEPGSFDRTFHDDSGGEPCAAGITDLTQLNNRIYAVGHDVGTAAAVWSSTDGRNWARVAGDVGLDIMGLSSTDRIAAVGESLVIGGSCWSMDDCPSFPGIAWISSDGGETWDDLNSLNSDASTNPAYFGNAIEAFSLIGDELWATGTVCDVVDDPEAGPQATRCVPGLWRTTDGSTWTPGVTGADDLDRIMLIEATESGLILIGVEDEPSPGDGVRSWHRWHLATDGSSTGAALDLAATDVLVGSTAGSNAILVIGSTAGQTGPLVVIVGV